MKIKISTVLLDAGGVILDEGEIERFCAEIITGLIAEHLPDYNFEQYWIDVDEAVEIYTPTVYKYVLWKNLQFDRQIHDRALLEFKSRFKSSRPPLRLMPGFGNEIKAIHENFATAIAGQFGREILALLENEKLLGYFTHHITQDDFELTKPDPRYYEAIVRKIGVDPKVCVMVGDRIDKDVIPAHQLGMKAVLVRTGIHRNQIPRTPFEIPDAELESIDGLAKAIKALL
ncbi:MAG: HAD family hydrolase [Candidatus Zixiibacteriota bacterium]|nr:MAG: HAD family hydrolase [candidate division Zixibacteria bacterium]